MDGNCARMNADCHWLRLPASLTIWPDYASVESDGSRSDPEGLCSQTNGLPCIACESTMEENGNDRSLSSFVVWQLKD